LSPWASPRLLTRRHIRLALGIFWTIDAGLQAEPPNFAHAYPLDVLAQSAMGTPQWENRAIFGAITPFVSHWAWWNLAAVVLQAAIGLALVSDRWVRPALVTSVAWAGVVWLAGEGLGGLPTGFALLAFGAPGPALLYAAVGLLAWPSEGRRDLDRRTWGVLWATYWGGGALLQLPWVYPPGRSLSANFEEAALGQPGWLASTTEAVARVVERQPIAWTAGLAAVYLAVAAGGLPSRRERRWPLVAAAVISGVAWVTCQGLGGVLALGASDVGTGPVVVLAALGAWPAIRRVPAARVLSPARRSPPVRGPDGDWAGGPGPTPRRSSGPPPRGAGPVRRCALGPQG